MTIALNVDGDNPNQVLLFQIESVSYYIHVRWNERMGWVFTFYDSSTDPTKTPDATPLLGAIKCMPMGLMTWRYSRSGGLFPGDILVLDTTGTINGTITRDNFGQGRRFVPTYFTQDELEEFQVSDFTSYTAT